MLLEYTCLEVRHVLAGQLGCPLGRQPEAGVGHAERGEQALRQELRKRPAGNPRQEYAEDQGSGVVVPVVTRLVHQRKRAEQSQPLVRRVRGTRVRFGHDQVEVLGRLDDRVVRRVEIRLDDEPVSHPEREQLGHGDRALGRHGVVDRAVEPGEDAPVGELGQVAVDRFGEIERAVVDEHHRERGDHRLGQRGEPERRLAAHRPIAAELDRALRREEFVVAVDHQHDHSGQLALVDALLGRLLQPVESGVGEGHVPSLP